VTPWAGERSWDNSGTGYDVRNVIFDLGGVVFDWDPDAILEAYYDEIGARAAIKRELFEHPDWLLLDRGVYSEADVIARLEQRTGRPSSELMGLFGKVRSSLRPKRDTVALIERLAQRQVPLYCLSNMPASTFAHLKDSHAFWPLFRGIVISGEIQMMKPEPEIFEYLLRRYELTPGETVFIDDHQPNVRAARELGIHTVWFRDAAQCEEELDGLLQPKAR
jgi:putative hydrolase of the HAD superfamily